MLNERPGPRYPRCSDVGTVRERTAEALDALTALRGGGADALHADAWRTIAAYVRRVLPTRRDEDERQDALLAILESVHALHCTNGPSAAAWIRAICRNRLIDRHRRRGGRTFVALDAPPVQLAEASGLPAELALTVVAAFAERIDEHLARVESRPSVRERRRAQAIAALRRTALDQSLPEIAMSLELSVSLTLLAKWVERGRAVIVATIEAERERDPDAADFFAPFAELALERRADAGKPRPGRRSSSS